MRVGIVLAGALALTGCGDMPQARSQSEIERIAGKQAADFTGPLVNQNMAQDAQIAELKRRVDFLEKDLRLVAGSPPPKRMAYQLVGASFQNEGQFKYATSAECEVARRRLLADWAAEDREKRDHGIIYTSRPTPSCLPL